VPLQLTRLQSTLKSEYRAGGDSLISTDSQECRTVQSHVGLPRWQPPVHEKDTATSSPPVQILHKAEGPDSKNNQPRFVSKKNPIVFLVREREKDGQFNHIPQYVSYVLLSSVSSHTYFTEQNTNPVICGPGPAFPVSDSLDNFCYCCLLLSTKNSENL
jgi:hypothetical protein